VKYMSMFRTLSVIYTSDEAYEAVVSAIDKAVDLIRKSGMDALIRMEIDRLEISIRGDEEDIKRLISKIRKRLEEDLGELIEKGDVIVEET